MFSLKSDKMTAFRPNESLTFTFFVTFSNSIPNWRTFVKEVFDLMFSLEGDEMTALGPRDNFTFTLYVVFLNSIPTWKSSKKDIL